jgi:hypothetical protein
MLRETPPILRDDEIQRDVISGVAGGRDILSLKLFWRLMSASPFICIMVFDLTSPWDEPNIYTQSASTKSDPVAQRMSECGRRGWTFV